MKRTTQKIVINTAIIAVIAIGAIWVCSRFVHLGNVEYTDNAQVHQLIIPVNSRVEGFIREVRFDEFRPVRKGDTLVIIEDAEYRLRLAQAEADYQNALAGKYAMGTAISTTSNNLTVSDAGIEEVHVQLLNAEKDYQRYRKLLEQEAVTQQQYDAVRTNYESLQAKYEMLVRQKQSTMLARQEQTQRLEQNEAGIAVAAAALDLARLNLSYTVILAPCDGVASRQSIQAGQMVHIGQTLLTVVDNTDKWVVANYRETQTTHMAVGQMVEITVDALPGKTYMGRIAAISQATGAQYSVVPQNNAAGNFVKVEQRIPVKIEFTADNSSEDLERLRAGLNVECEVNLSKAD